jgi:hypothetical protein
MPGLDDIARIAAPLAARMLADEMFQRLGRWHTLVRRVELENQPRRIGEQGAGEELWLDDLTVLRQYSAVTQTNREDL